MSHNRTRLCHLQIYADKTFLSSTKIHNEKKTTDNSNIFYSYELNTAIFKFLFIETFLSDVVARNRFSLAI